MISDYYAQYQLHHHHHHYYYYYYHYCYYYYNNYYYYHHRHLYHYNHSIVKCTGPSASWRGARDPAIMANAENGQRKDYNKAREGEKRSEFSGMGGMKRTR